MNEIVVESNGLTTVVLGCESALSESGTVTIVFPPSAPVRSKRIDGRIISSQQIDLDNISGKKSDINYLREKIQKLDRKYNRLEAVPSDSRYGRTIVKLQNQIENHVRNSKYVSERS